MSNILTIEGEPARIINPSTRLALNLKANYRGEEYEFSRIGGGLIGEESAAIILHFSRPNGRIVQDGLNIILLMTDCKGIYHATGLSSYTGLGGKPGFYSLGDDLEIKVSEQADRAIRDIPNQLRQR